MVNVSLMVTASMDSFIGGRNGESTSEMAIGLHPLYNLTRHKVVIVGRNTYEATLRNGRGRVFNNRTVVVLSRNPHYEAPDRLTAGSIDEAITLAEARGKTDVFVIGGTEVIHQTVGRATQIHLAVIGAFLQRSNARPFVFPNDAWVWVRREPKNKDRARCLFTLKKKGALQRALQRA
ncbi:MAG: Dihydrofolate reductase [Candidatus Jorgensenbacteria bacterium GW2011_GWA1_48_13]|uniref:Dihydrofolate reductase n=2 Tax=Candidatus Joergenseniibacteriota TaxID=1752739 RepID=A0A0G1YJ57_9BACT|nr:MAG: Dihydrofolate reductase [Candidatus Jorgensenbacteria bacterium GW2011_GWA1_48_13]KKU99338.1 MAG: Dihydrofolate reductase [Candidatus Jorgensenbacteria bacterium GW2011_GWC1_48_8]KKW15022.1 MAG: Dihydrofolate reductase [Candidatus Jorgensenbacteria bacterium GW2011_GWB1_50_10]